MIEYKSKYSEKSASIYGKPNYIILNRILSHVNILENSKILIPNCQDGIYVLPLVKRGFNITCYEENNKLLNGGNIDDFYTTGLKKRLNSVNKSAEIKNYNFYSCKNNTKYNLVVAIRTLQLKENDSYSLYEKINQLKNSVVDNGYLYLNYYIGYDSEVALKQTITAGQVMKYFDQSEWNIIYFRENVLKGTKHNKHPFNKKEHNHCVGYILVQKTPYKYNKRHLERIYKKASIYGLANQQIYDYIKLLQNEYKRTPNILIVDANDGKNVIPFAKKGFNITFYEENDVLLNGGFINGERTNGLIKRLKDQKVYDNIDIKQQNYYLFKDINKYDFIYVENSLNLEKNKDINMKNKIRKLMSNVKKGGYVYICYNLKISGEDNNLYLNYGEMKNYFDLEDWRIIYICERDKDSIYSKNRKVGYIFAMKINNRSVHKLYYKIEINNSI